MNPKAQKAMQLEWTRLRAVPRDGGKAGVWDESLVREWRHVRNEAKDQNVKANVGLVFGIVVQKNHELPESDPARKYKGRAVFQGNNVRDEAGNWAIFQELGSSPATMEAARCADAYGMSPGNDVEQCDAEQAYTQAVLKGTTTWIRLPRDQWPREWAGMVDPVCLLILALYGHPDSGGHWELHCAKLLTSVGFKELRPWRSCFWHEELKLFLVVYVDDFKLAGPSANLKKGWEMIRALVKTDTPSQLGLFLGCRHDTFTRTLPNSDVVVRGIEYNMEDFLRSSVERYKELTGVTVLRRAATPFIEEPSKPSFDDPDAFRTKEWDIDERLRLAADHVEGEPNVPKQLNQYAATILMRLLYAARYARFDLLRPICGLAQFITKWDERCDKRLYRLICYVNSSLHLRMTGFIGDSIADLTPHVFADADFAGCPTTSRCTSGMHHTLLGPHSAFPIAGQSRKQGCVSNSTSEAEVVSASNALRTCGLPALHVWDALLGRAVTLEFHEDNSTAVTAMKHGYSPAMKYIERTHGVCLRFLAERFIEDQCHLYYERTALMAADI